MSDGPTAPSIVPGGAGDSFGERPALDQLDLA
jgi:hypothetical protein